MYLDYDSYEEDLDMDLLYGCHEPIDPILREDDVNPDLEGIGRQYLE